MTQGSDTFAGATLLVEGAISAATPSQNMSPGLEAGEVGWHNGSFSMGRTAWWKFVAASTGDVSINLLHSEGVADWDALQFAMVALYAGDTLATLDRISYAFSSDHHHTTGLANSPELLEYVEAGTTYYVQASLKDGAADIDYRLQVARYADVAGDWVQDDDYDYTVPRYVDPDGDLVANIGGNSKMFDALDPRLFSAYVDNPSPATLNATIHLAQDNARVNPVNDVWSQESATMFGAVGNHPALPGGEWWEVDESRRRYEAAYREFTYAYRDYDALLSHEFLLFDAPSPDSLTYEWEGDGDDRSQVLQAQVQILVIVHSEEGTILDGEISPAPFLTHKIEVRTGWADEFIPAMPLESNDVTATSLDTWTHDQNGVVLADAPLNTNDTFVYDLNMDDYINTDGTFVLAGWVTRGSWDPPNETGYAMTAKGSIKVADCVYLVRPPRRRWFVRTYMEAGPAQVPYRRIHPRDDGLAGSARRNYPPAKAMQSGNRNVGGYL